MTWVLLVLMLMPWAASGATLNLTVAASNHDGFENDSGGAVNITNSNVLLGNWKHSGFYFGGVSGLSGATITTATVTFTAQSTKSTTTFTGDWYAQDVAAPAVITTTGYSITSRARTTAKVSADGGDFGAWTVDNTYAYTGDGVNTFAQIFQEIADTWDPSALFLIRIDTIATSEWRSAYGYDNGSGYATLDITYTPATSGPTTFSIGSIGIPAAINGIPWAGIGARNGRP